MKLKSYTDKVFKERFIPQVHKGSDPHYWGAEFDAKNPYRKITRMKWLTDEEFPYTTIFDGCVDWIEDTSRGKHTGICTKCGKPTKLKGDVIGNSEVGYELVYACENCKAVSRIYSDPYEYKGTEIDTETIDMLKKCFDSSQEVVAQ